MNTIARRDAGIVVLVMLAMALGRALASAADGKPTVQLPADRTFAGAEGSPGPVVFSHETHVAFSDGRCVACHPAPFRMLRPTGGFTHAEMDAGRQCGICHDGKTARSVKDDCDHCHGGGS
ncbi:MAG TPA: c(7)-type cytochrome triheme domain-containing protein [Candidatus Eisenbacteria bacterium]|nr:c(7)-type cytochrome triheme domain-containing protein [Candidatus Eisenbacteria bacterium]